MKTFPRRKSNQLQPEPPAPRPEGDADAAWWALGALLALLFALPLLLTLWFATLGWLGISLHWMVSSWVS